jgi:hypothetical protein
MGTQMMLADALITLFMKNGVLGNVELAENLTLQEVRSIWDSVGFRTGNCLMGEI